MAVDRVTVEKASFLNFDLEIGACKVAQDGRVDFPVRAAQTPRAQVQSADAADRVSAAPGEIDAVVAALANRADVSEAEFANACRSLEHWLLPQPSRVRSLLESSLAGLAAGEFLNLRIRCSDDNLARLPWEFATFGVGDFPDDGRFHIDRTLAMHPRICLVRFDELTMPVQRTEGSSQRLLFASAIPPELDALSLHIEREKIERQFTDAKLAAQPTWLEHVTGDSLQRALDGARFDVFQYSGHGGSGGGGFLCFEGSEADDGRFPAAKLGLLLADKGVRVAVLAACVTAEIEVALPWSSVARALVANGVPAVVGMQLNIGDDSAIEFLSTFYRKLAAFMTVGEAINEARKSIAIHCDRDFGVPVLYLRNAGEWDGVVFEPPPEETDFERRIRAADAYKRLHDALHKAKMNAFHLLLGFANDFPPSNERALRSYVNTMKVCVTEMRGIASEKRYDRDLVDRDLIDPIIGDLENATAQLDTAVITKDRDTFLDALPQLNTVFRLNMAMLDVSLHNSAKELDASLRLQLKQMIEDVKTRVVTHHACQRLENLLDDLRDIKNMDLVNVGSLKRRHQELMSLIQMCLPSLDETTASSLKERCELLDQTLASTDVDQLTEAYDNLCSEVGMSFFRIDSDLKGVCAKLCADPRLSMQ